MNLALDPLQVSRRLQEVNFTEKQAETITEILKEQAEQTVTNHSLASQLERMELRMRLYNGAVAVAIISILSTIHFFG